MKSLQDIAMHARKHYSKGIAIDGFSMQRPKNIILFNHSYFSQSGIIPGDAVLLNGNILCFPNDRSDNGGIITNPNQQYIFCNEILNCIAIGGSLKDKDENTHIFGAHIFYDGLEERIENIKQYFLLRGLTPDTTIISPCMDTETWDSQIEQEIKRTFGETNICMRDEYEVAEMTIGSEGVLLNDVYYNTQ